MVLRWSPRLEYLEYLRLRFFVVQTNHLSHFLLTNLLREKLKAASNARVINVSCKLALFGHLGLDNTNYEADSANIALEKKYPNSKLMNIMFTQELSRRWKHVGVHAFSCHPGFVKILEACKKNTSHQNFCEACK